MGRKGLPGTDRLTLLERLRQRGFSTPVLILSARRSVDDRVRGLQRGGDDYHTKPFAFAELLARLQTLIRGTYGASEPASLTAGPLHLDLLSRETHRAGKTIVLQPREYGLLEYLMRNAGRVVTKIMIIEHLWDVDFDPQTNVVDMLIHRLRKKSTRDSSHLSFIPFEVSDMSSERRNWIAVHFTSVSPMPRTVRASLLRRTRGRPPAHGPASSRAIGARSTSSPMLFPVGASCRSGPRTRCGWRY